MREWPNCVVLQGGAELSKKLMPHIWFTRLFHLPRALGQVALYCTIAAEAGGKVLAQLGLYFEAVRTVANEQKLMYQIGSE